MDWEQKIKQAVYKAREEGIEDNEIRRAVEDEICNV